MEDVVLPASTNLASEVERNSMMEKARTVLRGLPQEQQKMVELAFFEGMSTRRLRRKPATRLVR